MKSVKLLILALIALFPSVCSGALYLDGQGADIDSGAWLNGNYVQTAPVQQNYNYFDYPAEGTLQYWGFNISSFGYGNSAVDRNSSTSFIDHEGLLVPVSRNDEPAFTGMRRLYNLLATSSTPATQDVTLGIGTYMLQAAAGSATTSAGTATVTGAGVATAGSPDVFTVTARGTVTITVASMPAGTGFILHNITGESDQSTEREFIQSDVTYDGLGVAGVRYYSTAVDGSALATGKGQSLDVATTNKLAGPYNNPGPDMVSSTNIYASYDFTGWTASNATKNDANTFTATADGGYIYKGATTTIGKRYRITVAGTISTGTFSIRPSGTLEVLMTGFGTIDFTAPGTNGIVLIASTSGAVVDITTLTLYEIGAANSAGTFVSGLGTSAKASYATSWSNPFPGITCSAGTDGESSLELVSDTAKLASATPKLTRMVPSGKAYKAVAGASASMNITLAGNLSAATHTVSLYARGASAADDAIQLGDATTGVGDAIALTDEYQLISYTYTAAAAGTMYTIPAGDTVYFVLMQSEALTVQTNPVTVEGAAASRLRGDWTAPVADGINLSQAAGTVTVVWTAGFDSSAIPNGAIISLLSSTTASNVIYINRSAPGVLQCRTYDGTTAVILTLPEFSAGDTITFKATWSKARNKLNIYSSTASGTGWGTAAAYDGAFALGPYWYVGYGSAYPFSIKDIVVTNLFDEAGL